MIALRTLLTRVLTNQAFILACIAALFFGWFWQPALWVGLILAGWCTYFFRDPKRFTPVLKRSTKKKSGKTMRAIASPLGWRTSEQDARSRSKKFLKN